MFFVLRIYKQVGVLTGIWLMEYFHLKGKKFLPEILVEQWVGRKEQWAGS